MKETQIIYIEQDGYYIEADDGYPYKRLGIGCGSKKGVPDIGNVCLSRKNVVILRDSLTKWLRRTKRRET